MFAPVDSSIAILPTYSMVWIKRGVDDDILLRNLKHTHYQESSTWVLPIHREESHHWVVCTIQFPSNELFLYDSLASRAHWEADVKVCAE